MLRNFQFKVILLPLLLLNIMIDVEKMQHETTILS